MGQGQAKGQTKDFLVSFQDQDQDFYHYVFARIAATRQSRESARSRVHEIAAVAALPRKDIWVLSFSSPLGDCCVAPRRRVMGVLCVF